MPGPSRRPIPTPADRPSPACLFCAIVAGDAPGFVVERGPDHAAFLDIRPLFPGHALVVPADHVVTLADLGPAVMGPFFATVQRIERAVRAATGAAGSFVAMNNIVSQSVPHLHVHVVPRTKGDGLRGFFWPRTRYDDDEAAAAMARAVAAELEPLQ